MKRFKSFAAIITLIAYVLSLNFNVSAASSNCKVYSGSNINSANYGHFYDIAADTVKSYLTVTKNGYMRVQAESWGNKILIEYYDKSFNFLKQKRIKTGLPYFGGFYATGDNYYILSGQSNPKESDKKETFRITKYSKSWENLGKASLYGANTTIPFVYGSARMDYYNGVLIVRTCHNMYALEDGINHQANVTIAINTKKMKITDSFYNFSGVECGSIGHSLNQFVKFDNGEIIALDHGDAGRTRAATLVKYGNDLSYAYTGQVQYTKLLEFYNSQKLKYQYTGAQLGGLEASSSRYIVIGTTVNQKNFDNSQIHNVFIATVDKNLKNKPKVRMLTSYKDVTAANTDDYRYINNNSATNPILVKISNKRFMALWTKGEKIYYVELDKFGKKASKIHSFKGALSDCQPIVHNKSIVWYTWCDNEIKFYKIKTSNISKISVKKLNPKHVLTETEKKIAATFKKDGSAGASCPCGELHKNKTIKRIAEVSLSNYKYNYDGKSKKPTVTVKDSAGKKISEEYYTVKYSSGRKKAGKYKVRVKFKGLYKGEKILYFKIVSNKTG